jgi:hypothetical protein
MKNPDVMKQKKAEILVAMNEAIKSGDEEAFAKTFSEYTDMLQEAVLSEAQGLVQAADNQILSGRGARPLTSEETKYYEKLIEGMKSGSPKQALTNVDVVLPVTVIDAVFEDITEQHPLLNAINFVPTGPLVEILVSVQDGRHLATWDQLCSEIVKELTAGFDKIDLTQKKLSAFIPICKAMLDLGPAWIDRYVRTILQEAIANGLEKAIIDGTGINQPCGMRRDPNSALHPVNGYDALVPVPFAEFTPETYGGILAGLAQGPNGLYRTISKVLLVVNPVDYFTKIMPATVYQRQDGSYVTNIFPFPTDVVQSVWVPQNEAVIGIGKRYFMALGTSKGGKIEYSDEYHFLEDERVYLTKLYGNGKPLDSNSFKILNITDLKPTYPIVRVADYVDARLAGIELTDKLEADVDINFSENIHYYAIAVEDDTDAGDNDTLALEATTSDESAVIAATLDGEAVAAVEGVFSFELSAGSNVIVVTSSVGGISEAYVIVVTYTPIS